MAISLDLEKSKQSPIEIKYDPAVYAPLVTKLAKQIYNTPEDPNLEQLKQIALLTKRHPDKDNLGFGQHLPLIESWREQLKGKKVDEFFQNLHNHGFFASSDGIGIQAIDHNPNFGPAMADAVIIGNLEVLLKAAQELDFGDLTNLYSGDENTLTLSPSQGDSSDNQVKFVAKVAEVSQAYYNQPFFQELITTYPQVGQRVATASPQDAWIYVPLHKDRTPHTPRLSAIGSAIIDITTNQGRAPSADSRRLLVDAMEEILLPDRSSHQPEPSNEQTMYTELNTYESKFPRDLKVRKIGVLVQDIENDQRQYPHKDSYFIRLADVRLKEVNKLSHTLGDHHLIATINIVQKFLTSRGINPHMGITYYQHNGSFLLKLDSNAFAMVAPLLADPFLLNQYSFDRERQREALHGQDPFYRANPFVVATTTLSKEFSEDPFPVLKAHQNPQEIWKIIENLKLEQVVNETLVSLYTSGLGREIPPTIIGMIEYTMRDRNFLISNSKSILFLLSLVDLFSHFHENRPNNIFLLENMVHNRIHELGRHLNLDAFLTRE